MSLKKIAELRGEEILARDIINLDYQMILPKGATVRGEYIEKLRELGVEEVYIKEERPDGGEAAARSELLKSEIRESVGKRVRDILERHTYRRGGELAELSGAADRIIFNILEEEQVVERVYDIRERSADIYEHSVSVCSLAILTALKLGVDSSKIHDIGVGCLLHDIGLRYMDIDYNDRDVDTLSRQNSAEYKKHTVYGYYSLKDEDWISELSKNIILSHHEQLDGSGFPLHKKDASFECRIVNVCDTFDRMICGLLCERVKVYEAVEYLKDFKNILFDGAIIDAFLSFTAVYPVGSRVLTNEGELAVVIAQNREFQDRPVIRILKDKDGKEVAGEIEKNLVKVHHIFIEKVVE